MGRRRRRSESGFALLLVFLMAAVLAITLYMEIPRVAFQAQRNKEQLLMERGEQYKLAVRRFMQANKRWPASLDELQNLNNRRFLRRRYIDPMTGKDEWRLIHINNGILTDSKNNKQTDKKEASAQNNFVADMPGLGSTPAPGSGAANLATRRRASEGGTGQPTDPNAPVMGGLPPGVNQPSFPGQAPMPGQPGFPGQTGFPGQPPMPGQTPGIVTAGGTMPGGQPGFQPGQQPGQQPGMIGPQPGAFPGMPGAPVNSQTGGLSPAPNTGGFVGSGGSFIGGGQPVGAQPNNPTGAGQVYAGQNPAYPTTAGSQGNPPGFPNPGTQTGAAQNNQAIGMINNLLTTPRPGGLAGIQQQNALGGGAGIAGVASNLDADSIMVYADHTNYSEWEFIFDGKFVPPPMPNSGAGGTTVNQMGNMAGSSPPGTPMGQQPGQQGQRGPMGQGAQQGGMGNGLGMQGGAGGATSQSTNINLRPGRP
jgi:type II secretory pathway pseudopilin PulG